MMPSCTVSQLRGLLPFVRTICVRHELRAGGWGRVKHQIHQAEGDEQGDPFIPLLLSLQFMLRWRT